MDCGYLSAPENKSDFIQLLYVLRNSRRKSPRLSPRLAAALNAFDLSCSCKCSLIVVCALDTEPGCDERRKEGTCGCRPRWLATCLLESQTPYGCQDWREGHSCPCQRMHMPCCLATGCRARRKGKRCECPRTPVEICPHLQALLQKFTSLDPVAANRMADAWAEQLWTLMPGPYADRPLASAGCKTDSQEGTVNLMQLRETLGLSLWHPADQRSHLDTEGQLRRKAQGVQRLLRLATAARPEKGRLAA